MAKISRLGNYRIVRELGKGGMGTVFEAVQDRLERPVALKVLPAHLMSKPNFVERFKREARAASLLNHPNIVVVHDIGDDQGYHFFSMELVNGISLEKHLKKYGPLEFEKAIGLMRQAIGGLDHAWQQDIIHRDVKPDNLMLSKTGVLKIADFGLARFRRDMDALTETGAGMGTPYYMSAEQGANAKDVDLRADIYSLGATFYHLLTGRVPFEGSSPIEVAIKVATHPFPPVRQVRPETPEAFATLIEKMLSRQPQDRPQTAMEMLAALQALDDKISKENRLGSSSARGRHQRDRDQPAPAAPSTCPVCNSPLNEGAVMCMDCGFLIQSDSASFKPEPPNLCRSPWCSENNPPGARHCERCDSPLPIPDGTLLYDHYRIENCVKVGHVPNYIASDTKKGNDLVTIKEITSCDAGEFATCLNLFRREAHILRSLESLPVVPRVYDFLEQGQFAYLVSEFISGNNLTDVMEANDYKPFPLPLVVEWAKSICDLLSRMHSQTPPIIHGHLEPKNIMLLDDQQSIKVIAFGAAAQITHLREQKRASYLDRDYIDPYEPFEQKVGKSGIRSDLFRLAATLYHVATGNLPDDYHTLREIDEQLNENSANIPREYRWFFEMIKINMAESAADRCSSADEFKEALLRQQVPRRLSREHTKN